MITNKEAKRIAISFVLAMAHHTGKEFLVDSSLSGTDLEKIHSELGKYLYNESNKHKIPISELLNTDDVILAGFDSKERANEAAHSVVMLENHPSYSEVKKWCIECSCGWYDEQYKKSYCIEYHNKHKEERLDILKQYRTLG